MTRKDYVKIAAAVSNARGNWVGSPNEAIAEVALNNVVENLAAILAGDNDRFDRARFVDACGLS